MDLSPRASAPRVGGSADARTREAAGTGVCLFPAPTMGGRDERFAPKGKPPRPGGEPFTFRGEAFASGGERLTCAPWQWPREAGGPPLEAGPSPLRASLRPPEAEDPEREADLSPRDGGGSPPEANRRHETRKTRTETRQSLDETQGARDETQESLVETPERDVETRESRDETQTREDETLGRLVGMPSCRSGLLNPRRQRRSLPPGRLIPALQRLILLSLCLKPRTWRLKTPLLRLNHLISCLNRAGSCLIRLLVGLEATGSRLIVVPSDLVPAPPL
jgi:hypothetical protein